MRQAGNECEELTEPWRPIARDARLGIVELTGAALVLGWRWDWRQTRPSATLPTKHLLERRPDEV
jgi:hypothetical protein